MHPFRFVESRARRQDLLQSTGLGLPIQLRAARAEYLVSFRSRPRAHQSQRRVLSFWHYRRRMLALKESAGLEAREADGVACQGHGGAGGALGERQVVSVPCHLRAAPDLPRDGLPTRKWANKDELFTGWML